MAVCYYDSFGRRRCRNNAFSSWGRWIVLGLILLFALLFLLSICITTRRRRARGHKPFYGTGWIPGAKPAQGQNVNDNANANYGNEQNYQPPYNSNNGAYAPPQEPKPTYGQGQQTYGGQQNGYEMNNNSAGYQAPPGPPPGQYQAPPGPPPGQYQAPSGPPPQQYR
ncbi:hypothetical protein EJ08DRAFT_660497 [Tothia fuscella]|uniref:Chitin synthesis regulation, Congo red resistance, RCR protein n=1 Tax=Tothia fuscella TaxID=1048955 RepID=A0A9P4NSY8_9PEZI|nr:hypothetical protein EJ08DRAFT_660497 [Tothia fuscella]